MTTAIRTALSSLPNGTIYSKTLAGALIAAPGASAFVYRHGTTTQVTVFSAETGVGTLGQPLTADSNGQLPGWVAPGQDLDVVATYGGVTNPAALAEPQVESQPTFTDSGDGLAVIETIGAAGNPAGALVLYGKNGSHTAGAIGLGKPSFTVAIDVSAATPYRDFAIAKINTDGSVTDANGIYISHAGTNPSSIGIGVAQPADSGRSVRLKVVGGATTQGELQLIHPTTGTTVPPFSITDLVPNDRFWIDPTVNGAWTVRIAGDTTTATTIISVQDYTTPSTVTFSVGMQGNVTMRNPGAAAVTLTIANSNQTDQIQAASTGELQIGNNSFPSVIQIGNHLVSWNTIGFFGVAAVARPAAYTLNAGATSRNLASGGTLANVEQVLRQLITDLQAYGLLQ